MEKIFYGGGGFLGIGSSSPKIEIPEPVSKEDLDAAEKKKMRKQREREAKAARGRTDRQSTLLTGSGTTAGAPTKKASLLGRTAQS